MAGTTAFEHLSAQVEEKTDLDRLEARGTIRLALKKAGLDARSVQSEQLAVVVREILPEELGARGVSDAEAICRVLEAGLGQLEASAPVVDSPEAIFARLAGS